MAAKRIGGTSHYFFTISKDVGMFSGKLVSKLNFQCAETVRFLVVKHGAKYAVMKTTPPLKVFHEEVGMIFF